MAWYDWFVGSTPGGVVGEAGAKVVGGMFDGIKGIIEEFHLAPEQEMKLKLALEQQKLEYYQAAVADVQSARQMQMQTRSVWPGIISTIMLIGYFAGGIYILRYGLPETSAEGRDVIMLFVTTLTAGVTLVLGFWLGSSNGSQEKSAMLFRSKPSEPSPPPSTAPP